MKAKNLDKIVPYEYYGEKYSVHVLLWRYTKKDLDNKKNLDAPATSAARL